MRLIWLSGSNVNAKTSSIYLIGTTLYQLKIEVHAVNYSQQFE
jgi:hypothetical protein